MNAVAISILLFLSIDTDPLSVPLWSASWCFPMAGFNGSSNFFPCSSQSALHPLFYSPNTATCSRIAEFAMSLRSSYLWLSATWRGFIFSVLVKPSKEDFSPLENVLNKVFRLVAL